MAAHFIFVWATSLSDGIPCGLVVFRTMRLRDVGIKRPWTFAAVKQMDWLWAMCHQGAALHHLGEQSQLRMEHCRTR